MEKIQNAVWLWDCRQYLHSVISYKIVIGIAALVWFGPICIKNFKLWSDKKTPIIFDLLLFLPFKHRAVASNRQTEALALVIFFFYFKEESKTLQANE